MQNHFDVVAAFAAKFGLPDNSNDDARREWTGRVAQTLAAKFPAEGWGTKRADPGRPLSADVVCTRSPFVGVDLLNGSTGQIQWGGEIDLAGQVFVPVEPHDWLATATPEPPETPADPLVEDSLAVILARLESRLAALEAAVHAITVPVPPVTFPVYEGSIRVPMLGSAPVTLTPKKS